MSRIDLLSRRLLIPALAIACVMTHPASLFAAGSATSTAASTEAAGDLCAHIRLAGSVLESPPSFSLLGDQYAQMTLRDWLFRLAKARQDSRVRAVALEIDSPGLNWAQAQELADGIRRLNAVKPVYTYLVSGDAMDYLVASAGKEVVMEPAGTLEITGLGAEMLFFRGTLDWIGVEPQMIQIGRYKGASEPMTQTQPSKELMEVYDRLLDDLYGQLAGQIAQHRKLSPEAVKKAIDEGPFSGAEAGKFHLVDSLMPKDRWRAHVASLIGQATWEKNYGQKPKKAINLSNPFAILSLLTADGKDKIVDPAIAIIHAEGVITTGYSGEGLWGQHIAGAKSLTADFDEVADDNRVKAVVFRIDSPGGSALASELIFQAVQRCAKKKPVIASVASMAASGGYYVAVGAPTIYSDASGITGSIGVISGKFAIKDLLGKLKISTHEMTRGKNAGLNMMRPWTDREAQVIRRHAQETYDVFVKRVKDSRGKRVADIDAVAEGRVFTGPQAVANGLVDKVGGLREAVAAAQKAAGLPRCNFVILPHPKTLLELLTGEDDELSAGPGLRRLLGAQSPWEGLLDAPPPLAGASQHAAVAYLLTIGQMFTQETALAASPCYFAVQP